MSDNPFASMSDTVGQPNQAAPPAAAPTGVTTVAVFALILGIMGLMGSCFGGVGIAFQTFASEFLIDTQKQQGAPPAQVEFLELSLNMPVGVMISNIVIVVLSLFVGIALIVGGVGAMRGKESGRAFLRTALLMAMVYLIFKIVTVVYTNIAMSASLRNGVEKFANDPIYAELKQQVVGSSVMQIVSAVIGVVISLALMGFYFWARGYLNRENVVAYFAAKS